MDVPALRSQRQQISRHDFRSARDVVAWLGAVQAQDPAGVRWAVGVRLPHGSVTEAEIGREIDEGRIVRTHAMRFTWQLVAREDARWMIELLGPRVLARAAGRFAQFGLDAKTLAKSDRALAKALRGGAHLTRAEVTKALNGAGIATEGRLSHLLGWAELAGILCNGARRGKQPTWALFDERIPSAKPRSRDDALRELAKRYFQSRAPATTADFVWWSGLAPSEARAAMELADVASLAKRATRRSDGVHLLPPFDEYLVAYKDRSAVLANEHVKKINAGGGLLAPVVIEDGRVIGTWRRTLGPKAVTVEHQLFAKATATTRRAIAEATERYVSFIGG